MLHTDLALRRPVTTLMTFAAVSLIGLISAWLLPLEKFPDIQFPGMTINIPYQGSTPEEVEQQITRPVEEALATLSGIKELRSTSTENGASFEVGFGWGGDSDTTAFEVRTKLDSIRHNLPAGANRILIFSGSTSDLPIVVVRIAADKDLSKQYELLERHLKRPLERIAGIARVTLQGVEPEELRILIDPTRLAAYRVDIGRLRQSLERANFSVSAGEITERGQRLLVRPIGEFRTLDDVRNFLVQGNLRLADIADVSLASPELSVGRHLDGKPGVGLDVFKSPTANVIDVTARVMAEIERARHLPELQGVEMIVLDSAADNIKSSLSELRNAGLIGAALALLVLWLFLRDVPTTLIVSLAVPFSLVITLAAMYFLGFSLNILTMMGMMLAIGMLVDNAVVVTESIFRHRQLRPQDPVGATLTGVSEVGVAVLAGTAATVIVFLPIVFGEKTQISILMSHVGVPIVVAMVASLLVAQTIIPTLTARFPAPPPVVAGSRFARLQDRYSHALRWVLTHRWKTAGLVTLTLLSPVPLFAAGLLKTDMFPQDGSDLLQLQYNIQGNYPLARVEQAVDRVESYFRANRERFGIDLVYSVFEPNNAYSIVMLKPADQRSMPPRQLVGEMEKGLPEIIIGKPSFKLDQNQGAGGFSLQLRGESTGKLTEVSADVVRLLATLDGLDSVHSTARSGDQEVQILVDRARAAQLGLTAQDVATTVAAAMRGEKLREFRAADREIEMRLAFRASDRQTVEDLARLPLYLPGGGRSTLDAVATFRLRTGERAIPRIDRMTSVEITGNVAQGATLQDVKHQVESTMKAFPLPAGYSWSFGRGVQEDEETGRSMVLSIVLSVALIYLVMASLFESALYPLSIVTSILFGIVGVFWGLTLTATEISFMALLGIMILVGVVVNIGIVLVAHIIDLRRAGLERTEAILQAGRDRLRPILMTTCTTLLAMLPLAVGNAHIGGDGPAYYPMARALIGGLAFGAATSLFFVPAFYVWFDDFNAWRQRITAASRLEVARGR